MKLAFVYPPFFGHLFNENLPTVDDEFGLFPHIGFGWAARGAKAAGWDVKLFDCPAEKLDLKETIRRLKAWNPDLIGFAAHACQTFKDMLLFAQAIRAETGIPTLVGGYEAKAYPSEIMSHKCFDFLLAGEAPQVLPDFLAAFERGRGYESVPALVWRKQGGLARTDPIEAPPFSEFPTPDRSIFPNERYYSHISQRRSFTIGMSEVGCPYACSFCSMRKSGFAARSAEQIIEEMEECIALGIREIDWFDPLMLHDRQRALDIAREVKRRKLDIIWSCRSRIDTLSFRNTKGKVDEELIQTLAEGGCKRIYFGIESGDDRVLKAMRKAQKQGDHQRKVLECVASHGIMALGFFILGAPSDDVQSVQKTIDYSLSLPLAYAQYQIAIIKPHTELEKKHLLGELGFDYWRRYMRGEVPDLMLPTPWTKMPRAELEKMAREAYFRFYGRPRYALQMFGRIESVEELVRYGRVGAQMLARPLKPTAKDQLGRRQRFGRAAVAFGEAMMTIANPGARHPVFALGGGVKGALTIAKREYGVQRIPETLTPERARALEAELGPMESPLPELVPADPPAVYEPAFDRLAAQTAAAG